MSALSDLIRPWDGEKVSVPGAISGLPIEIYHGTPCAGPSISSTGLRQIRQHSAAHYWDKSPLNPNRTPDPEKDYFNLGQAAHMLFLGETGFLKTFTLRPDVYADPKTGEQKPWNSSANACKWWLEKARTTGKRVLTSDQLAVIKRMAVSLSESPLVQTGILNGEIETSLLWQDPETGVWLKSRPDVIPTDARIVSDLKTTADAHPMSIERTITSLGYHMQLALAQMGLKRTLDLAIPDDGFALVFIESSGPCAVSIVEVDAEAIYWGRRELRAAIRTFADCLDKGRWPAYGDDARVFGLSDFHRKRLQFEDEAGLLPPDYEDAA